MAETMTAANKGQKTKSSVKNARVKLNRPDEKRSREKRH